MKMIIKAARPATLSVAVISTTLGIICAYKDGFILSNSFLSLFKIVLVTIAGLLLQSGVNLINNYFEEQVEAAVQVKRTNNFLGFLRSKEEILIFKAGLICILCTAVIGIYLSIYSGIQLLFVEIIGIFAAYAYSGYPFNYKNYGIGALMSFIMMGPLMTFASYFVFSSAFSIRPILYSCITGLYIPAILIANEIRDYEEDKRKGIGTLTVRIGYKSGIAIYYMLIVLTYLITTALILIGALPLFSTFSLVTILFLIKTQNLISNDKKMLIKHTAKSYLLFGVIFLFSLIV